MRYFTKTAAILSFAFTIGLLTQINGAHWSGPKPTATGNSRQYGFNASYQTRDELTETEFLSQLDKERRIKYNSLDQEGKNLALEMANDSYIRSKEAHESKSCGYGTCQRGSHAAEYDPNSAVEDASRYMMEKPKREQGRKLLNGFDRNDFNPKGQY